MCDRAYIVMNRIDEEHGDEPDHLHVGALLDGDAGKARACQ